MRNETVARAPFLAELERAKGIGILLVVVGHLVAVASLGPDWYAILKWLIYQFHMPFFMYLSGFAFAWTRPFQLGTDYATYLKRRAQRLLIPFFLFGVFIVCAKYFSGFFVYVDDYPESLLTGLSRLLFHTEDSPALSIWYIFVLFVFSVASFPLGQLDRAKLLVLLAVAVVVHFVYVPDFLYANRVFYFYMFFVVGMLVANDYDRFRAFLNKYGLYTVGLFLIALPSVHFLVPEGLVDKKMICGLLSMPALHFISVVVHGRVGRLFEILGYYTFPIYLMNTLAIGGFKAIYIIVAGNMTAFFGIYLLGAMIAGILAPILAYIVVNRVSPGVAKYLK